MGGEQWAARFSLTPAFSEVDSKQKMIQMITCVQAVFVKTHQNHVNKSN